MTSRRHAAVVAHSSLVCSAELCRTAPRSDAAAAVVTINAFVVVFVVAAFH